MRYKTLILIFISIVIYTIYFININNEENTKLHPRITIKITPKEYIINSHLGDNLISLINEEIKTKNIKVKPYIHLNSRNDVKYTRVKKTINELKFHGYEKISLASKNEKF